MGERLSDAELVHIFVCYSTGHGGSCDDWLADYDAPSWRQAVNGLTAVRAALADQQDRPTIVNTRDPVQNRLADRFEALVPVLTHEAADRLAAEAVHLLAADQQDTTPERRDDLRDEHCYITSVDGCCHCGDSECDGLGCIASLDADDEDDHEAIEDLHATLRAGQAWQAMERVIDAGAPLSTAHSLASEALAYAENRAAFFADETTLAAGEATKPARWVTCEHGITYNPAAVACKRCVDERNTAPPATGEPAEPHPKVVDLMQALEDSVKTAKEARRRRAADPTKEER